MHPNSAKLMTDFVKKYLYDKIDKKITIVDIGSYDVNGNYKSNFNNENWKYIGIDLRDGDNVDLVLSDPYKYPFDNNSIDVVISGQTIEHCKYPWKVFEEIYRVIKYGGLVCVIAPSFGGKHEDFDAWRILPDGMNALCEWSKLTPLETFIDNGDSWWLDCVLIATKKKGK